MLIEKVIFYLIYSSSVVISNSLILSERIFQISHVLKWTNFEILKNSEGHENMLKSLKTSHYYWKFSKTNQLNCGKQLQYIIVIDIVPPKECLQKHFMIAFTNLSTIIEREILNSGESSLGFYSIKGL